MIIVCTNFISMRRESIGKERISLWLFSWYRSYRWKRDNLSIYYFLSTCHIPRFSKWCRNYRVNVCWQISPTNTYKRARIGRCYQSSDRDRMTYHSTCHHSRSSLSSYAAHNRAHTVTSYPKRQGRNTVVNRASWVPFTSCKYLREEKSNQRLRTRGQS